MSRCDGPPASQNRITAVSRRAPARAHCGWAMDAVTPAAPSCNNDRREYRACSVFNMGFVMGMVSASPQKSLVDRRDYLDEIDLAPQTRSTTPSHLDDTTETHQ